MKEKIVLLSIILSLLSCDGYLRLSGNVYTEKNNVLYPLDSANVKILRGKNWIAGQTVTDEKGNYVISGMKHFRKEQFYILFQRKGFGTDTLKYETSWNFGKTIDTLNHKMTTTK